VSAAATFRDRHRHPFARFMTMGALAAAGLAAMAEPAAAKKAHHKAEPEAIATSVPAAPELTEAQRAFKSIEWTPGPTKVSIGDHAELQVPAGFAFTAPAGARKLLELMHNTTDGSELGVLADEALESFVLFEFEDIGYVKDAEKEKLDADEILESIREGNEGANAERKKRGWAPIHIVGWHTPPFYNRETQNLEWCIKAESQGHAIVNYNTRILGRQGVMSANLLVDPDKLQSTLPEIKKVLAGFHYVEGKRYSQYLPGDKVAKYGLAALVVGGAAGLAAKAGFLAKIAVGLGKIWKALVLIVIGLAGGLRKVLFGKKINEKADDEEASTPPPEAKTPPREARTPPPEAKTPPPEAKTPPPEAKTPPPGAKTPPPGAKTPPPEAKTPPPEARTPPPEAKTPPPEAKTPPPEAKTPPPEAKTPPPAPQQPPPDTAG